MIIGPATTSCYTSIDFVLLFPELFLSTASLVLLVYGVVYSTSSWFTYPLLAPNVGWLS